MTVIIEQIGGNCPVQAEGTIDGKPFYFRARGETWSLGIGGEDPCAAPEWECEYFYGDWPDAGWMTVEQAKSFIESSAKDYMEGKPPHKLEDDVERYKDLQKRNEKLMKDIMAFREKPE